MEQAPIKTKRACRRMLKEIEGLMTARCNMPEGPPECAGDAG